jgi:flagellar biosynthetic protein FliR
MIAIRTLEITLLLTRFSAFITFLPVFSDKRLPKLVKIGFALSMVWLAIGTGHAESRLAAGLNAESIGAFRVAWGVAGEMMFGASLGFAFGILFEPARIAGAYISQEMGLTMASLTDPTTQQTTNVVSHVIESWAVILFFVLNLHHVIIRVMYMSVEVHPLGQGLFAMSATNAAYEVDLISKWGLLIASPVGICLFITVVSLGLLMRAVPQMNIFSIGLAIRLAVGTVAMVLFMPVMTQLLIRVLQHADRIVPSLF